MGVETRSPVLEDYLGRVRSHLPLGRGADIVRELESSIRDRVDDMAAAENRTPDDDLLKRALTEMGEPETVAGAYVRERSLVGPAEFRPFLFYTAIVFAIHLALLGVATTLGRALQAGPVGISPVAPHGILSMAASAVHALLLDVGLMVFVFAAANTLRTRLGAAPKPLRVDVSKRGTATRALLAVLVAVVLNFFRDRVFVVVVPEGSYPLFTHWFAGVLPLITGVLAFSVVSDVLYLVFGERRFTVALDALHGVAAIACLLFMLRGDPILSLPGIDQFAYIHGPVNNFLDDLGTLVIVFLAVVFAVKTVRRLIRFAQV